MNIAFRWKLTLAFTALAAAVCLLLDLHRLLPLLSGLCLSQRTSAQPQT